MAYLLIGLGNPGKKFESTRHNAGKMFVGWMSGEAGSGSARNAIQDSRFKIHEDFRALETECFMNESGEEVYKFYKNYKDYKSYKNLFIAHDDLDIPLGKFKIQFGKGPRLHNGVLSVEQALGTKEFWRVRIGIDGRKRNPPAGGENKKQETGEQYVLKKFSVGEKKILEAVFPEIKSHLVKLINVDVIV